MGRRSGMGDATDALELFLDTICNAFGGIIFISLLVCVMLQLSGDVIGAKPGDPIYEARLKAQLEDIQGEIEKLTAVRQTQIKQLPLVKSDTDPELIEKYTKLSEQQVKLDEIKNRLIKAIGVIRIEVETSGKHLAKLVEKKDKLEKEHAILATTIKKQKDAVSQVKLRVPQSKTSRKRQVAVLLSEGRMSFVSKFNNRGASIAYNNADVKITEAPGVNGKVKTISPRAGRGAAIDNTEVFAGLLTNILAKFNAKPGPGRDEAACHYFMVAVWPDSHKQFEILRDMLAERGFGYGLILMKEGESVSVGSSNGAEQ
jgi:hypothetical protein